MKAVLCCTADKAEGPWHITHLPKGFYDPGLFFDDDGKVYVAQGYNKISITEVNDSLVAVGPDSLVLYRQHSQGSLKEHMFIKSMATIISIALTAVETACRWHSVQKIFMGLTNRSY